MYGVLSSSSSFDLPLLWLFSLDRTDARDNGDLKGGTSLFQKEEKYEAEIARGGRGIPARRAL